MGDSDDDQSRDSFSSGRDTPIPRSRSPSVESVGSTASKRSRLESPDRRSRSPIKMDREKAALIAENRALKRQLEEMSKKIEDQQRIIERLQARQETQHAESMARLTNIAKLLETPKPNSNRTTTPPAPEAMETDQDAKKQARKVPEETAETARKSADFAETARRFAETAKKSAGTAEKSAGKKNEEDENKKKEDKIPPVILRNKDNWNEISKQLKNVGINYTKARLIGDGIQVFPARAEDYRALTRLLNEGNREYHTYSLPENRLRRIVIRGLPDGLPLEEIKEDLEVQGFSPRSVQRMKSRRTKKNMPLVLVQVPEKDIKILEVARCCGLVVRTEAQKQLKEISQCHRCQRFGHSQSNCSAKPRCVKCAGAHHSGDCKKPRTDPARCANCEGQHPASYKGCPKYPSKKTTKQKRPQEEQKRPQRQEEKKTEAPRQSPTPRQAQPAAGPKPKSFAEAAKRGAAGAAPKNKVPAAAPATAPSTQDLTAMLAQMQQMCAAMSAFFAKMPAFGKF